MDTSMTWKAAVCVQYFIIHLIDMNIFSAVYEQCNCGVETQVLI